MEKKINAESISSLFLTKGFSNTSKWLKLALETKMPNLRKDFGEVIDSLKIEVRNYKREYYNNSIFKEDCSNSILKTLIGGMIVGSREHNKLTAELVPIIDEIIEINKILEDIVRVTEKLDDKPKFYMLCFYYLILWEGSYKNIRKNLLAMKRLNEGKKVIITETSGIKSNERIESEKELNDVLPNYLQKGIHENLRNAIAHAHFRYLQEKNKMEFWDIHPKGEYSLKPRRFSYQEFSKYLLEINLFCETFGFLVLLLIALSDIAIRRHTIN